MINFPGIGDKSHRPKVIKDTEKARGMLVLLDIFWRTITEIPSRPDTIEGQEKIAKNKILDGKEHTEKIFYYRNYS
jgi:hypothetical protein